MKPKSLETFFTLSMRHTNISSAARLELLSFTIVILIAGRLEGVSVYLLVKHLNVGRISEKES